MFDAIDKLIDNNSKLGASKIIDNFTNELSFLFWNT